MKITMVLTCFKFSEFGQLGVGDFIARARPERVPPHLLRDPLPSTTGGTSNDTTGATHGTWVGGQGLATEQQQQLERRGSIRPRAPPAARAVLSVACGMHHTVHYLPRYM